MRRVAEAFRRSTRCAVIASLQLKPEPSFSSNPCRTIIGTFGPADSSSLKPMTFLLALLLPPLLQLQLVDITLNQRQHRLPCIDISASRALEPEAISMADF